MVFTEFKKDDIPDDKVAILIDEKIISEVFSLNTLDFIRENYSNHVISYLKNI